MSFSDDSPHETFIPFRTKFFSEADICGNVETINWPNLKYTNLLLKSDCITDMATWKPQC